MKIANYHYWDTDYTADFVDFTVTETNHSEETLTVTRLDSFFEILNYCADITPLHNWNWRYENV